MVLDSVVDKLANLLADLVHILPSLSRLLTIDSIVFLHVNEGVEMTDAGIWLYCKLSDKNKSATYHLLRISCKLDVASRRIRSRPMCTSFFTPSNLFDIFRITSCKFQSQQRPQIPGTTNSLDFIQYLKKNV